MDKAQGVSGDMLDNFKKQTGDLSDQFKKAADDAQDHAEDLGEIAEDAAEDIYIDVKDSAAAVKAVSAGVDEAKKPPKMFLKKLQKQKKMLKMQRKT